MSTQNHKIKVSEIMLGLNKIPVIIENVIIKEALEKMDVFRLGIACIVDNENKLKGIITDGDIRRKLLSVQKPMSAFFLDDSISQAIKNPVTISSNANLIEAVNLMEIEQVWDLPVVDGAELVGLLHLHAAIKGLLKSYV